MRTALVAALALAVLAAAPPARACSVCAAGDPLVGAGDAAPDARDLRVALETEWLTASAGTAQTGTEELEQATFRAVAAFSPLARVNVALSVPFVYKHLVSTEAAAPDEAGHVHEADVGAHVHGAGADGFTGLGDVELGARLFLLDRTDVDAMRHHTVALSAGSSFPTGENGREDDAGVRIDEHSQLGSGAYGPYLGVLYRLEQSRWHAFASLSGRLRTENEHGYRYGAALTWTLQAQRQLRRWLAVGVGVDGREAAQDELDGGPVADTGGLVLAAVPSVHVGLGRQVWLSLRGQLPFATRLRGEQDVGPTVTAGVQLQVF